MRAFLIAAFALVACAQPSSETTTAPPPQTHSEIAQRITADLARLDAELAAEGVVAAGIGETADLRGGLTIRPIDVTEDSRCPANVDCVWAGRLVLRANVSGTERDLTLGEPLENAARHGSVGCCQALSVQRMARTRSAVAAISLWVPTRLILSRRSARPA